MKTADVLLLFAPALCCIPDYIYLEDYCVDYEAPKAVCPMEYNPVCRSDDVTYDNKCLFCNTISHQTHRMKYFGLCQLLNRLQLRKRNHP